jgi:hypothetical protein
MNYAWKHDDRSGHFEKIVWSDERSEEVPVSRLSSIFSARYFRSVVWVLALLVALLIGFAVPAFASGILTSPAVALNASAPPAQSAPIENSIFPALLQVALIVLVTEGIKSLAKTLGGVNADGTAKIDLSGKAAAYAYIIVGVIVYAVQMFLLPNLPPNIAAQLQEFLGALAVIVGGSGLYNMTSAFRVQQK